MVDAMLYLDKPLKQAGLLDQKPMRGALELRMRESLHRETRFRSVLYLRMAKTGAGHMPLIGPRDVDAPALNEIFDWILSEAFEIGIEPDRLGHAAGGGIA